MNVVVATNNAHKLREIREIMADCCGRLDSLADRNIRIEIEETGATFEENALIKARAVCALTGDAALADDSGLCVAALDGAPGVHSARFAGEPCDDDANNALLLERLRDYEKTHTPDRRAEFVTVVALARPDGSYLTARCAVPGEIIDEYRGENGFGYDPIFFCPELNKTFGEASSAEKNSVSHRARALAEFRRKLQADERRRS